MRETAFTIRLAFKEVLTIGNYDLGERKPCKQFELSLEFPRQPNIVRIEKPDKLATRRTRAHVPCASRPTPVLESQHTNTIAKLTFEQLDRRIGRSIINNDHFNLALTLRQRSLNRLAHQLGTVPRRNYNTEQWRFHFAKRI